MKNKKTKPRKARKETIHSRLERLEQAAAINYMKVIERLDHLEQDVAKLQLQVIGLQEARAYPRQPIQQWPELPNAPWYPKGPTPITCNG